MNIAGAAGADPRLHCQGLPPYVWEPIDLTSLKGEIFKNAMGEDMGSKDKFWFFHDDKKWLFKYARGAGRSVRGEDWAECLVHVIAQLVGVPSACTALAEYKSHRGVVVKTILRSNEELVHGNELLAAAIDGYDKSALRHNQQYSLANIKEALDGYSAPAPYAGAPAFDWFAGYLMMDALVAGRDRHHENWGVISCGPHVKQLAPSFDHGNALGFAEPLDSVTSLMKDDGEQLEGWLERGYSEHFPGKPTLVQVAVEALALASPVGREFFLARLHDLPLTEVRAAVGTMPSRILSEPQCSFVVEIVKRNRRRLCDAIGACERAS